MYYDNVSKYTYDNSTPRGKVCYGELYYTRTVILGLLYTSTHDLHRESHTRTSPVKNVTPVLMGYNTRNIVTMCT